MRTVYVADAALQQKLASMKPGQVVQFDYTEAQAASIRPSAK
jgi:cold shock CspA family protein